MTVKNPMCLKTLFLIKENNFLIRINKQKKIPSSLYGIHIIAKRNLIDFNMIRNKTHSSLLYLFKIENIQSKILSIFFANGIYNDVFFTNVFTNRCIYLNDKYCTYYIHEIPKKNILLSHKNLVYLINSIITQVVKNVRRGKIHGYFSSHESLTGRLSSVKPNIQNIYKQSNFRKCFNKYKYDNVFVTGDFSSFELYIISAISNDKVLINSLLVYDFHSSLATFFLDKKVNKYINKFFRSQSKIMIFSVIYGIGISVLSKKINITYKTSLNFVKNFLTKFFKTNYYIQNITKTSRKKILSGLLKKKFMFNNATATNLNNIYKNISIQSAASEVLKFAAYKMYIRIASNSFLARFSNSVHDELLLYGKFFHRYSIRSIVFNEMSYTSFLLLFNIKSLIKIYTSNYWK